MGKRITISENLARISMNDSTDGEETKRDKSFGWKKALTSAVQKGAESSNLIRRSVVPQLDERGLASRRTRVAEMKAMRKQTILVVDDDQSILMTLSDYLTQVGYEALTAKDLSSCLEIFSARSKDINLAMLDIKIGRESGFDLADILEDKFRFYRYIFLTAFFWEEKTLEQLLQRGKPYFEKPLKFEKELLPFLKQYFGEEQGSS